MAHPLRRDPASSIFEEPALYAKANVFALLSPNTPRGTVALARPILASNLCVALTAVTRQVTITRDK